MQYAGVEDRWGGRGKDERSGDSNRSGGGRAESRRNEKGEGKYSLKFLFPVQGNKTPL